MMKAAYNDHHAIVQKLLGARADPNTKNNYRCALPGFSPVPVRRRRRRPMARRLRLRLRRPAGAQRCTMRCTQSPQFRTAATPHPPWRCSSAAPTRPSRPLTGNAAPPAATPTAAHRIGPNRRRYTPRQDAQRFKKLAEYDAAVAEVRPPASSTRSSFSRRAATPSQCHARSTAQAALFGVRRHTRGMMCASHCARSAAAVGRQRAGREHTTLRRTVRGASAQVAHTGT